MADTAIWSTFSWPRANILSARALSFVLVWLVLAFGLCFACSCDQNVRACLLVSSRRYFYKVYHKTLKAPELPKTLPRDYGNVFFFRPSQSH